MSNGISSTPVVPQGGETDPTALTREMILHEVNMLREVLETRLDAMDKAVELLQKYPTDIDSAIGTLKELHGEKFKSIDVRFSDSKTALDAAFASAKESSAKVETNFTKQIDGLVALITAEKNATESKIADIKDRITIVESVKKGSSENWIAISAVIGVIGVIFGIIVGAIALSA